MPTATPAAADDELMERARKRVGMKLGFYTHALVFVLVNLGLYALDTFQGGHRWSHFPLWGWGLGLAIHGIVTFLGLRGEGVRDRMLAEEVARLRRRG
ncbi:2TM domain-containing protein [Ideonella sp.]|uniref:2TM domain-containing protein n=1 Tax=Ideonella sp. TaxID=1929293 RepID=UPI0035B2A53B